MQLKGFPAHVIESGVLRPQASTDRKWLTEKSEIKNATANHSSDRRIFFLGLFPAPQSVMTADLLEHSHLFSL